MEIYRSHPGKLCGFDKGFLNHLSMVLYLKKLNCTFTGNVMAPKIFTDIFDILTLILANNKIHSIIRNSCVTMAKLTYIDLRDNQLHSLNSLNFVGLTSIEHLDLYNFQITSLEMYSVDGLIFLKMLNLSNIVVSHFMLTLLH